MPNYRALTSKIDLTGSNVVAVGGTQGIGAGVALRFAELGASVLVVGRNKKLGAAMVESLKERNSHAKFGFLSQDLGTAKGIKEAAEGIASWAGDEGIHYLFQSQGGAGCLMPPTVEVLTVGFNVQVLSHFLIPLLLLNRPTPALRQGAQVINVGRPGEIDRRIDFDDFTSLKAAAAGKFSVWADPLKWVTMTDAFTWEFNRQYPQVHTTHVYPGPVSTGAFFTPTMPWYVTVPWKLAMSVVGMSVAKYSDIAVWQTASEEAKAMKRGYWDQRSREVKVDPRVSSDAKFRQQIWDNLLKLGEM